MKIKKNKVISLFLTLFVVVMLVLMGSVSAVQIEITMADSVAESSRVFFNVSVDIEDGERVPFANFTVSIKNGSGVVVDDCTFDIRGNNLSSCGNFYTITPILNFNYSNGSLSGTGYGYGGGSAETNFGYGYGYGYGLVSSVNELVYRIEWLTPTVTENSLYNVTFSAYAINGAEEYTYVPETEKRITVTNTAESSGGSSSSSSSGSLILDEEEREVFEFLSETDGIEIGDLVSIGVVKEEVVLDAVDSDEIADLETLVDNLDEDAFVSRIFSGSSGKTSVGSSFVTSIFNGKRKFVGVGVVEKLVEVYGVVLKDNRRRNVTRVSLSFSGDESENFENLEILQVIPKSIALSASDIGGKFEVLYDDPVIKLGGGDLEYLIFGEVVDDLDEIGSFVFGDRKVLSGSSNVGGEADVDYPSSDVVSNDAGGDLEEDLSVPAFGGRAFSGGTILGLVFGLGIVIFLFVIFFRGKKIFK